MFLISAALSILGFINITYNTVTLLPLYKFDIHPQYFFFVNYMYIYNSAGSIQVHLEPFLLLVFSLFLHIPFDFGCNDNNLIVNIMIPLVKTDPHNDQFVMEQNTDSDSIRWNEWTISIL